MKLKELKVAIEGVAANGCSLEEKRALESAIRPALVGHFGSLTEQENDAFLDATDSGWYPDTAEEAGRHLKAWRLDNQEHKILAALERAYLAHVKQVEIEFPKTPTEFLGQYQELHSDLCRRRNAGEPVNKAIDKAASAEEMIAVIVGLKIAADFVKHMKPVLETVWVNGAKSVYGSKLYDLSIKKSVEFIKARGVLLKKSPEFLKDSVINFIKGEGDSRSIADLTADIKNKWTDITASRAELIAKTETAEALAEGAETAMVELDIPYKRWVNMGDSLVRDEHMDSATGVFAKVGETFKNGMTHPGGYNCRCWLEAATEKEAKGA